MAKKTYKFGSRTKITEHFHSSEFDEKIKRHKENHDTIVDTDLVEFLETLRSNENISKIIINSGYRCKEYNRLAGGSPTSAHIDGKAADIVVYDKNEKTMLSRDICLLLEDMNFKGGVGFRSGGNIYETHVDIKNRKSYFDEGTKPYTYFNSFYEYFGIKSANKTYTGIFPSLPNTSTQNYIRNGVCSKDNIKSLQSFLNWALNEKLVVDGIIGPKTTNAVIKFQKLVGLTVDGKFGKNSLKKAKEFSK